MCVILQFGPFRTVPATQRIKWTMTYCYVALEGHIRTGWSCSICRTSPCKKWHHTGKHKDTLPQCLFIKHSSKFGNTPFYPTTLFLTRQPVCLSKELLGVDSILVSLFLKRLKIVISALMWCVISVSWGCITVVVNGACEWCRLASYHVFPAAEKAGAATPRAGLLIPGDVRATLQKGYNQLYTCSWTSHRGPVCTNIFPFILWWLFFGILWSEYDTNPRTLLFFFVCGDSCCAPKGLK